MKVLQDRQPDKGIGTNIPDVGTDLTVFAEIASAEELLRRMGRRGWTDISTSVEKSCESLW